MPRIAATLLVLLTVTACIGFNVVRYPAVRLMLAQSDYSDVSGDSSQPDDSARANLLSSTPSVVDSSSHDSSGYDSSGYDSSGYDSSGYDSSGYDSSGYDSSSYNQGGGAGMYGTPIAESTAEESSERGWAADEYRDQGRNEGDRSARNRLDGQVRHGSVPQGPWDEGMHGYAAGGNGHGGRGTIDYEDNYAGGGGTGYGGGGDDAHGNRDETGNGGMDEPERNQAYEYGHGYGYGSTSDPGDAGGTGMDSGRMAEETRWGVPNHDRQFDSTDTMMTAILSKGSTDREETAPRDSSGRETSPGKRSSVSKKRSSAAKKRSSGAEKPGKWAQPPLPRSPSTVEWSTPSTGSPPTSDATRDFRYGGTSQSETVGVVALESRYADAFPATGTSGFRIRVPDAALEGAVPHDAPAPTNSTPPREYPDPVDTPHTIDAPDSAESLGWKNKNSRDQGRSAPKSSGFDPEGDGQVCRLPSVLHFPPGEGVAVSRNNRATQSIPIYPTTRTDPWRGR